jgi:hypothetical protein
VIPSFLPSLPGRRRDAHLRIKSPPPAPPDSLKAEHHLAFSYFGIGWNIEV